MALPRHFLPCDLGPPASTRPATPVCPPVTWVQSLEMGMRTAESGLEAPRVPAEKCAAKSLQSPVGWWVTLSAPVGPPAGLWAAAEGEGGGQATQC